jgi:hypothetical protein
LMFIEVRAGRAIWNNLWWVEPYTCLEFLAWEATQGLCL